MSLTDDLLRLKELDPATHSNAYNWLRNTAWNMIRDNPEKYFLCPEPYPLRDAMLQHCLQESIAARHWCGFIAFPETGPFAEIHLKCAKSTNDEIVSRHRDTPAAALLAAYIAALEAHR